MILYDLAVAARKSGLPVVEQAGWQNRGHGPLTAVRSIICHHTAGPATGEAPSLGVVTNGRPGLDGPLANLVLGRSGTVYVVAAGLCWHAGVVFTTDESNGYSIGIEAEATGVDPWPPVQWDAYARLCRALADHYGLGYDRVLGHKEVARPLGRKIDPNFDMPTFRATVHAAGSAPPPPPPPTRRRLGEDAEMFIETAEPAAGQPKWEWPTRQFSFGFDIPNGWGEAMVLHATWGGRGGWIHLARWWVRDKNWTASHPLHFPVDNRLGDDGKGHLGSERFVGYAWCPTPPANADELELIVSAPDGLHLTPFYKS